MMKRGTLEGAVLRLESFYFFLLFYSYFIVSICSVPAVDPVPAAAEVPFQDQVRWLGGSWVWDITLSPLFFLASRDISLLCSHTVASKTPACL